MSAPEPYTYRYPAAFNYEPDVGVLDIRLAPHLPVTKVRTEEVQATVLVDRDDEGRVVGIEVLGALGRGAVIASAVPEEETI